MIRLLNHEIGSYIPLNYRYGEDNQKMKEYTESGQKQPKPIHHHVIWKWKEQDSQRHVRRQYSSQQTLLKDAPE